MSEQDPLPDLDWIPIPRKPFIMKYVFTDTEYNIIVSNLTYLYGEKLTLADIQKRFSKLNPYAKMKPEVILENVKKSLQQRLNSIQDLEMRFDANKVIITVTFIAGHVLCKYDIEMVMMPPEKFMEYIVCPTVFGASLSQRKVLELKHLPENTRNVTSQNRIEPEWLRGQNVTNETLVNSFLQLQSHLKDLYAENYEACVLLKKEETKKVSAQSTISPKKLKLQDNIKVDSTSIEFEDDEQTIIVKKETASSDSSDAASTTRSQPTKTMKKRKPFQI